MLFDHCKHFLEEIPESTEIFVAYSGGVDSHVLLFLLAKLRPQKTTAIHVHHGLLKNADSWANHCKKTCKDLGINCIIIEANVKPKKGESIEAAARTARYQAFEKVICEVERIHQPCLLTAHHQDDQSETCLLQIIRGSGPRGLASMPKKSKFANGYLVRPFLNISRAEILNYAKANNLYWIEDDSNHNTKFARNYLRYELMPILKNRWPAIGKCLFRVAKNSADADELLQDLAKQDYQKCMQKNDAINIFELKKISIIRQKNLLRYWLLKQNFLMPSATKLEHIVSDVINARNDAEPLVHWDGVEIRRFKNGLFAMHPLLPHDFTKIYAWNGETDIEIPNIGKITSAMLNSSVAFDKSNLTIRFRQGGEKIIFGENKKRELKKVLQEREIPPWMRNRIPLIYSGENLVQLIL